MIANGGYLVTPTLVKAVVPSGTSRQVPEPEGVITKVPVKKEHIELIKQGMIGVVNEPHGTGARGQGARD